MSAEPAEKIEPAEKQEDFFKTERKKTVEIVKSTHSSEIVIALCGPIGTPLHSVAEELRTLLTERFGYKTPEPIRLSKFIEKYGEDISNETSYKRIKSLIKAGDSLRESHGSGLLAELAIREISNERLERAEKLKTAEAEPSSETSKEDDEDLIFKPAKVCHIIDSIKNEEELEILRLVYRDMLHCIGVVSPLAFKVEELKQRGLKLPEIYDLIDQDSGEEFSYGQKVRNTFPLSDFFLRVDSNVTSAISGKLERYLNIILDTKIETPYIGETAMYMAASAATKSACLSRQVGASITDKDGNILSIGWNDVPRAEGGLYEAEMGDIHKDQRCKNLDRGECKNDTEKQLLAKQVAKDLRKKKIITEEQTQKAEEIILKSRAGDLIEFSRAIHAEMYAIIQGGQKTGQAMVGGKLFCTTYPCHSCARHIIMAGIMEVYYIEPYRKSLATKLHGDAISEDENEKGKVRILPFDGVAPNRYLQSFTMKKDSRKNKGAKVKVNAKDADLKHEISIESLPVLEAAVVKNLEGLE